MRPCHVHFRQLLRSTSDATQQLPGQQLHSSFVCKQWNSVRSPLVLLLTLLGQWCQYWALEWKNRALFVLFHVSALKVSSTYYCACVGEVTVPGQLAESICCTHKQEEGLYLYASISAFWSWPRAGRNLLQVMWVCSVRPVPQTPQTVGSYASISAASKFTIAMFFTLNNAWLVGGIDSGK